MPKNDQIAKQSNRQPARAFRPNRNTQRLGVWDRIKPIGFDPDDGICVLLYGDSGTGKTTVWSTFPGPILAMLCSGGLNPGELRSVDTEENRDRIQEVVIYNSKEVMELVDGMEERDYPYKTIVLDHISGLEDKVLAEILNMEELPAQKSWGLASREEYGQCTLECKSILKKMLGLHCNVVIVAHERIHGNKEETGSDVIQAKVGAGVAPKLAGWLHGAVDYIGQCFKRRKVEVREREVMQGKKKITKMVRVPTDEIEYCLRTAAHDVYTTKFRKPKGAPLPAAIVDPDYDKILSIIKGTYDEDYGPSD